MSVRRAAESASISEGRWRSLAKGTHQVSKGTAVPTRAPADTLARMARVVGATPDQLQEVGRQDAAEELVRQMTVREVNEYQRAGGQVEARYPGLGAALARLFPQTSDTPHDEHFERAERLLRHSHESIRAGDYLGAIHGLEGVWSTVELLVDRITDEALLKGIPHANEPATSTDPTAESNASHEARSPEEVTEPPSTIDTALGDAWREAVDWDSVRTPEDVQKWVSVLAKRAIDMHGPTELDLNDFAEKIAGYAESLRRDCEDTDHEQAEQADSKSEGTKYPRSRNDAQSQRDRDLPGADDSVSSNDDRTVSGTPESKAANAKRSARRALGNQTPTSGLTDPIETPR